MINSANFLLIKQRSKAAQGRKKMAELTSAVALTIQPDKQQQQYKYENLPGHLLVQVFHYLKVIPTLDKVSQFQPMEWPKVAPLLCLVCKNWKCAAEHDSLWRECTCKLYTHLREQRTDPKQMFTTVMLKNNARQVNSSHVRYCLKYLQFNICIVCVHYRTKWKNKIFSNFL